MDIPTLVKKINGTDDLQEMGALISQMHGEYADTILQGLDVKEIAKKIEESRDTSKIAYLLERIGKMSDVIREEIESELDLNKIVKKIQNTPSLGIIFLFDQFSDNLVFSIVKRLNLEDLVYEIHHGLSTWAIGLILNILREKSYKLTRKLVNALDLDTISKIINNDQNVWGVSKCLREILAVDPVLWETLVSKIDYSRIASRLEKINPADIGRLVETLSVHQEEGKALFKKLDLEMLAEKINESTSTFHIVHLIETLLELDETRGNKLLQKLNFEALASKINKESKNYRKYVVDCLKEKKGTEELLQKISPI